MTDGLCAIYTTSVTKKFRQLVREDTNQGLGIFGQVVRKDRNQGLGFREDTYQDLVFLLSDLFILKQYMHPMHWLVLAGLLVRVLALRFEA
jgi:hypothetical protein